MRLRAKVYIGSILTVGAGCLSFALPTWRCADPVHYLCHLVIALIASGWKVTVPRINSTVSVSYVFVVLSMIEFSYPETVAVACAAMLAQCLWRPKYRPDPLK